MTVVGHMGHLPEYPTKFDGKGVKIFLRAPIDDALQQKISEIMKVDLPCGHIAINKDLLGKRYEIDDEVIIDEPIIAYLDVTQEAFSSYDTILRSATTQIDFRLEVAGPLLPAGNFLGGAWHGDLETSKDSAFAVTSFTLTQTIIKQRV